MDSVLGWVIWPQTQDLHWQSLYVLSGPLIKSWPSPALEVSPQGRKLKQVRQVKERESTIGHSTCTDFTRIQTVATQRDVSG